MNSKYVLVAAVALSVLVLDQATKLLIDRVLDLHQSVTVIPDFFHITYIRNKGAAFGILAGSPFRIPFFLAISSAAIVVIVAVIRKLQPQQRIAAVSLALILSGAVGNLIDRLRLGEVIDFLDVHWYEHHWPAFNVADSAICVGVFLLAVDMYLEEKGNQHRS